MEFLRPFQERVKDFDNETLQQILTSGADKARKIAADTLSSVYTAMAIK